MVIPEGLGQETAIRVALTSLHHPDAPPDAPNFTDWEGKYRWVNSLRACVGGAEMGFAACTTQAECEDRGLGGTCQATTMCSDSLVFGTTFRCAVLGCEPEYRDWATELDGQVLHVTGASVVPSSGLSAAQLALSCQGNEATCTAVSEELPIITTLWGNVDDDPDLNVLDVAEVVDKVKELPGALSKARAQLQPNAPDPTANVNVLDVATAVDALKNKPYKFAGAFGPCTDAGPGEATCP